MRNSVRLMGLSLAGVLALTTLTLHAQDMRFAANLERSLWELKASRTRCVLSHDIPNYGQARFAQQPEQDMIFSIDIPLEARLAAAAELQAVPSPWNHQLQGRALGQQMLSDTSATLALNSINTQALFTALEQGQFIEIAYRPGSDIVASVSAVRFLSVVDAFHDCVSKLRKPVVVKAANTSAKSPNNQASNTAQSIALAYANVSFEGTDDKFSETVLVTLTGLAREYLTQKDPKAVRIIISGGSGPDSLYQRRATDISTYLSSHGLPKDQLQILKRGQLPKTKNTHTEAPPADTLQVHLMR